MKLFIISRELKNRLDTLLVAGGTNIMNRLAACHFRLKSVSERTAAEPVQLVTLLLCRPIFHGHQFFFKLVYSANDRRIRRLGLE